MLNVTIQASRIAVLAILLTQGQSAFAQTCTDGVCSLHTHENTNRLTAPTPRRTPALNLTQPQNQPNRFDQANHQATGQRYRNQPVNNVAGRSRINPNRYTRTSVSSVPVWQTDIRKAGRVARDNGQPMLIRITADWCGYCKKMKADVFANPGIQRDLARGFVTVEIDADKNKDLVQRLGIQSLPTTIILTPDMQIAERMEGYRNADQVQEKLNRFLPRAELQREIQLARR